ncbi:hypothetical protein F5884DRAFT_872433 [Xylogone sp. PMI_703]|nr:hypothetical protein F5884DRAFT_872433 [Xylogone sp. PMI_703]
MASFIPFNASQLDSAESRVPNDTRVHNINLVRFREYAKYENNPELNSPPISGKEAYLQRYIPAFYSIVQKMGLQDSILVALHVMPCGSVVVSKPGEEWDAVAVVTYPSWKVFRTLVEDKEYLEQADIHRVACASDYILVTSVEA